MMMFLLSSPAYPVGVRYVCGCEYKSRIADDSTLLLSALGVPSIYYTRWLSRESNLWLICPGGSQLQNEVLQVESWTDLVV